MFFAKTIDPQRARPLPTSPTDPPPVKFFEKWLPEDLRKSYIAQVPLRRFGKPEEVAACVLFLASREASYVTGSTLEVTGGL